MDPNSLQPYKDAVTSANNDVANQTAAAPGLLKQLQSNLTSIFAKDNPFIAERGTALQSYLNAPSQSRTNTLPTNLPTVEGSNLNLSPTQQNSITTASRNAALVPLMGLNQIVTGLYGNIPGMVQGAGDLYQGQIEAARQKAQGAQQSLAQAYAEMQAQESSRQFQQKLEEEKRQFDISASQKGSSGMDSGLAMALMSLLGGGGGGSNSDINQYGGVGNQSYGPAYTPPPLSSFDQPEGDSRSTFMDTLGGLGLAAKGGLGWLGSHMALPRG